MVRLAFTSLDGMRREIPNPDGLGKAFIVPPAGGIIKLTHDQYERAKPFLKVFTQLGSFTFTMQTDDEPLQVLCGSTGALPLSGLAAVDGVTPVAGNLILVKNQGDAKQNGIYEASAGAWSRLTDLEELSILTPGLLVQVNQGTVNADGTFVLTSNSTRIGIDDINFQLLGVAPFDSIVNATTTVHDVIVEASTMKSGGATSPTSEHVGNLAYLKFNHTTDAGFKLLKIPTQYAGNGQLHVHWTKGTDADESTNVVLWRVNYVVFDGETEDASGAGTQIDLPDTYLTTETTGRVVHETSDIPLTGLIAGYYLSLKITCPTPVGTPVVDPALVSVDFMYDAYINKDV